VNRLAGRKPTGGGGLKNQGKGNRGQRKGIRKSRKGNEGERKQLKQGKEQATKKTGRENWEGSEKLTDGRRGNAVTMSWKKVNLKEKLRGVNGQSRKTTIRKTRKKFKGNSLTTLYKKNFQRKGEVLENLWALWALRKSRARGGHGERNILKVATSRG